MKRASHFDIGGGQLYHHRSFFRFHPPFQLPLKRLVAASDLLRVRILAALSCLPTVEAETPARGDLVVCILLDVISSMRKISASFRNTAYTF
jgi:hypothetical protein